MELVIPKVQKIDQDWLQLMVEAKEAGLTPSEVKEFLRQTK
ncbi:anti-repressor SinI family protein [Sinobaca sp. H24]|nr:anti-repressor SinI family protein [Sinobaca sp. H24]